VLTLFAASGIAYGNDLVTIVVDRCLSAVAAIILGEKAGLCTRSVGLI
jgi:hypothetical protein